MKARFLFALSVIYLATILPAEAANYNYVNPTTILPQFITSPPNSNNPILEAEADSIIKLQQTATREEIAAANYEEHIKPDLMDKSLSRGKFPKTYALLDKVDSDCYTIVRNAKNYFNTDRPYLVDKRIKALISPPTNSPAYPSGHTACSRVYAEVLSHLSPNKRESWRNRADDIAEHRIIAGLHWPHDISGGRQIGFMIFGALQMSPAYKADLVQAKQEWPN